ncbi:hypothetical protein EV401DRAFT_1894864 [Pisolithus croceorrhizus]|nr:hypothetical protein EV401DRAFT_1894864 [Pisolithus croceorrhizus]
MNITLQPTPICALLLLNPAPLPPLNQNEYLNICFWTKKEWKSWSSTTADRQHTSMYTSFLEEKDGNVLKGDKIGSILQTAWEIWHKLRSHEFINIDMTWSSMSLTVKKSFWIEITQTHQELNLCKGLWKSDMIGKKHYGSFKQTQFTNRSDAKGSSNGRNSSSSSDSPSILPSSSKSSEASMDDHASNPMSTTVLPDVSVLGPVTHSTSLSLWHTSVNTDKPSQSHDNCARMPGDCAELQTIPSTREGLANNTVTSMSIAQKPSSIVSEPNDRASCPTKLPQIDQVGTRNDPLDHTDMSAAQLSGQTEAGQVLPAPVHLSQMSQRSAEMASKQVSPPTVPNRKKTWHPPSNKSARMLCMHCYQKQVGGLLEEFNSYFEALSGEVKVKYKDEAKELVTTGIWINGMADVIAKFWSYVLAAGWVVWHMLWLMQLQSPWVKLRPTFQQETSQVSPNTFFTNFTSGAHCKGILILGEENNSTDSLGLQELQESVKAQKSSSKVNFKLQRPTSSFKGQLIVECPPAQYSKYNLYDLVDKQKKVKINSSEALLDYQLCFTEVATHLQVMNQLSSIEKDDLFLEGFDREFQSEILQRLEWNGQRQHTEDPWPTCQVTQEAKRLFKKGYHLDLRQVHMVREQLKAEYEARTQESRARKAHERCNEKSARLGSRALKILSSTALKVPSLTHSLQDSSKLSKVPGGSLRGQALKVDSSKVAVAELSCSPLVEGQCQFIYSRAATNSQVTGRTSMSENPLNEPQEALDETRTVERPVEPAVHALEVPKPPLEPKDDLHKAPEQAGSHKVEEVKQKIKAKMRSKVVAWRKPPEEKTQRKSLKSVIWRMKDIIPGLWTAHSNARMDLESQCRDMHNKSECAYLFYKSESCLLEGYEVYGGKVKAPHSGGWSTNLESMATSSTRKLTKKDASRVRTPQAIWSATSSFEATRLGIELK